MEPSGEYTRFNYQMREWLSILLTLGKRYREIGRTMGMHHTSISREINKNSHMTKKEKRYQPFIADTIAEDRREGSRNGKIREGTRLERLIERLIIDSWSPDAIAGWLKRSDSAYVVSHETIWKTAANVAEGVCGLLGYYHESVKTITYDNGTENSFHLLINKKHKCKSYFCNPYHSWEKGSVENAAGLMRRHFPMKTDFSKATEDQLKRVEKQINNLPRKLLNYETPQELFRRERCNQVY